MEAPSETPRLPIPLLSTPTQAQITCFATKAGGWGGGGGGPGGVCIRVKHVILVCKLCR